MPDSIEARRLFLQRRRRRAHWGLLGVLVGSFLTVPLFRVIPRTAVGPLGFLLSLVAVAALLLFGWKALSAAMDILALERNQNEPE